MLIEEEIIKAITAGKAVPKKQLLGNEDARSALEAVGFKVLGDLEGEPLYFATEVPEGWQTRLDDCFGGACGGTSRSWVKWILTDGKGRSRGELARFYNPNSDESWVAVYPRFGCYVDSNSRQGYCCGCVVDRAREGMAIFRTEYFPGTGIERNLGKTLVIDFSAASRQLDQKLSLLAKDWLAANYPDWQNPGKYWD